MKGNRKKLVIVIASLATAAAIVAGVFLWAGNANSDPVKVYPFQYMGMTEYWGDSEESYGFVQTDGLQAVYLSTTQTVTEILVQEGDEVKKGDVLLTFDTTLSDLALERKRLEVEKLKLQLQDEKNRLAEINSMRPMVIPQPDEDAGEDENLGEQLTDRYRLSFKTEYDGSSKDKPMICWLNNAASLNSEIFQELMRKAGEYQKFNAEKEAEKDPVLPPEEGTDPSDGDDESGEPTQAPEPTQEPAPTEDPGTGETPTDPDAPAEPAKAVYVVVKVTEGNRALAAKSAWEGLYVQRNPETGEYSFRFFDATLVPDHMLADDEKAEDTPEIDYGSGFTAAQIAQMRSEQEKTIKDVEFNIKMAEAEYKIAQTEVNDGNVYAQIDGKVLSVLDPDEAMMLQQPVVKVSAGGGFYVEGSVSELDRDTMVIGQEVSINDWNTGMVYTGSVVYLGDYPSAGDYWNGTGNPNATYYPFRVFVDESADLQAGRYVSISFSADGGENGIYLENPFLRTENGRSYVYLKGADGRLEKRYVTTGKSLWGSYTEILTGLTEEDYIAFPYGKNVREGAKTEESEDMSELYG